MTIERRLSELLTERGIQHQVYNEDDDWHILYLPLGFDGPIEEINHETKICDLHWLDELKI
jgi:hypothetical protein